MRIDCGLSFSYSFQSHSYRSGFDDEPILTKPDQIAGMRFSDYLNTLNWTDELKNQLQDELIRIPHTSECLGTLKSVEYPEIRETYIEENVCAGDDGDGSRANSVKIFSISVFFTLFVILVMVK